MIQKKILIERLAFADAVKDTLVPLVSIFGWTRESLDDQSLKDVIDDKWGFSRRDVMKHYATGFTRGLRGDIWITILDAVRNSKSIIVPDVRFENEASYCRKNGFVVHIVRGSSENGDTHESEMGIAIKDGDMVIDNNGSLDDLESLLSQVIKRILKISSI